MNSFFSVYASHPYIATLVTYWGASAFIGALPAPTATASQLYLFLFKFTNTFVGNLLRAYSSKVETSPNFQQAVVNQNVSDGTITPAEGAAKTPPDVPLTVKP